MVSTTRALSLSIGVIGLAAFGVSLAWEHVWHASPCIMCSIERWIFAGAGIIGMGALLSKHETTVQRFLGLLSFLFAALSVILFRHMGTQYHWFKVPGICRAARPLSESDLSDQLMNPISQATCDQIEFTVLGQPPTFYLFCLSTMILILCIWGFLKETPVVRRHSYRR